MPGIITRYLVREILKSSAATVLVLFVILMSNALGRVLSEIADGDIPQQALWPVLLGQSLSLFSLLLPVGFFLGIVFAFGRLYKDHEIVVMNACGLGNLDFYRPLFIILVPLLVFTAYCTVWLNAAIQRQVQDIIEQETSRHEFNRIRPGQFNQGKDGDYVFYMESISEDRRALNNIVIGQSDNDRVVLETARTGRQRIDENSGDLFLVVGPGQRYEGSPGEFDFKIISFEQHGILIEKKQSTQQRRVDVDEKTLSQLMASTSVYDKAELHWRIAVPVVILVLAILAVPLSYIAPRQGRYGQVGYAFLVYLVYFNLLAFTRAQIEAGTIPAAINFWWVHLLFLALALSLLARREGWFRTRAKGSLT